MEKELLKEEGIIQDQIQSVDSPAKKIISKKIIMIIVAVVVTVILLVVFATSSFFMKTSPTESVDQNATQIVYSTEMRFKETEVTAQAGKQVSVDIEIDTHGKAVSGATVAVQYNPNVLSNVKLTQVKDPTSAIANSFESAGTRDIDGETMLFLNALEPTPEQKGTGIIARLTFTPKATNVTQTEIKFSGSSAFITRIPEPQIGIIKNSLLVKF